MLRFFFFSLAEGCLTTLPGLSLFPFVFICIFSRLINRSFQFLFEWFWLFRRQVFWSVLDGFWWMNWRSLYLSDRFCVFFLWLFYGISLSLLWLLLIEFVLLLDEFWQSEGFSAAPETLANHLVPIGSASPWDLCIWPLDCFVWLGPLSVSWKHKCSLPYRTLL